MGGKNETVVPAKKSSKSGSPVEIGSLRVHESGGEIHFHDDSKKLKCAVPVSTWYLAWSNLWKNISESWMFADMKNKTCISAKIIIQDGQADIDICVEPLEVSQALTDINKFTEG